MSDRMTPIPFGNLTRDLVLRNERRELYLESASPSMQIREKIYEIFGRKLETPFGSRGRPLTPSWPRTLWRLMWQAAGSLN